MEMLRRMVDDLGVAFVGGVAGSVRFGFTERAGGVSKAPFATLNLGTHVGDDPRAVEENRRRALAALGAGDLVDRLLVPNQVHGSHVAVVDDSSPDALARVRAEVAEGADAVVCTVPDIPVMLCFADCVPVILSVEGAFAVIHSGWKGTYAGIAGKAAEVLARVSTCPPERIRAFIGPHILGDEYEVSSELMDMFKERFSSLADTSGRLLDLSLAIRESLEGAGVAPEHILDTALSTMKMNDRFFSYRLEGGTTGRHAAVAVMRPGVAPALGE